VNKCAKGAVELHARKGLSIDPAPVPTLHEVISHSIFVALSKAPMRNPEQLIICTVCKVHKQKEMNHDVGMQRLL